MSELITETVRTWLADSGAVPREQDLYAGVGTDFYERLVGTDRAEVREVLALARAAADPILDVAAGSGRLTIPLVRAGRAVTAIDLSDDMLSHLRRALPDHPGLQCVVADMRDFDLDRRYGLVVLGATSITLLDRADRSRFYASALRHLAAEGVLALTVAAGTCAAGLTAAKDQEIRVPGPSGGEAYLFSQQLEPEGSVRVVNWVRISDVAPGALVPVLTSRLQVLSPELISRELIDAGFVTPTVSTVKAQPGEDIVLLTTSRAESGEAAG